MILRTIFSLVFASLLFQPGQAKAENQAIESCEGTESGQILPEDLGQNFARLRERILVDDENQAFLSLSFSRKTLKGRSPAETKEKVATFFSRHGLKMDSYVDYDSADFFSFEEKSKPKGVWESLAREKEREKIFAQIRSLENVEALHIYESRDHRPLSISIKLKRRVYPKENEALEKLLAGFSKTFPKDQMHKEKIWASSSGDEKNYQWSKDALEKILMEMKKEEAVIKAEMKFRLGVVEK